MRLLIFTQKIDKNDSVLGFFHTWVKEFASKAESIEVICLEKGDYNLPKNVTVYSLGKESSISKLGYIINLYKYLSLISGSYDKVLVHMNQEYVILAGLYWKIKNIPVYLWRNHPNGSLITRLAVLLSTKVFCTSKESFTARFKKTVIMPVGIDTKIFKPVESAVRKKYSVCMIGRIAPIKNIELALKAVNYLVLSGTQISFSIVGSPLPKYSGYYEALQKYVVDHSLSTYVNFSGSVTLDKLPEIYSSHEVCLNLTPSGSFDKTIVEGASCGAIPLVANESLIGLLPETCITKMTEIDISRSIRKAFDAHQKLEIQKELTKFVDSNNLDALVAKLFIEIQ